MQRTDAIDPTHVDWTTVRSATYRVEQTLAYEYESPIADLRQRLHISPRVSHGDQRRLTHRVWSTAEVPCRHWIDRFGNTVAELTVPRIERSIAFSLESTVRRRAVTALPTVAAMANPAWQAPRRLIRPDAPIQAAADELHARYRSERERAEAIVAFVHASLTYTKGVTDVFTTASVAFRMGHGVCQDFAHLTIALARACGLGARYVSGHLLGDGATHAWVELLVRERPERRTVLSFDPTHGCPTSLRYVTVAIGRDYDDVAPTSGVFTGASSGTLRGTQRVVLTGLDVA